MMPRSAGCRKKAASGEPKASNRLSISKTWETENEATEWEGLVDPLSS